MPSEEVICDSVAQKKFISSIICSGQPVIIIATAAAVAKMRHIFCLATIK